MSLHQIQPTGKGAKAKRRKRQARAILNSLQSQEDWTGLTAAQREEATRRVLLFLLKDKMPE